MKYIKYFYLFMALLVLIIIIQNLEPSGLNILFWKLEMPKGILWGLLFGLGALLSELRNFFIIKNEKSKNINQEL